VSFSTATPGFNNCGYRPYNQVIQRAKFVSNQEAYMPIEWPTVIEGGIPILGGLYGTALGYGVIRSSKSMSSPPSQKYQGLFRWLGPIVVLFGIFTAWQTHLHVTHPSAEQLAHQIAGRLSFPVKVDDTTQWVGVQGKGDDIIYNRSVTKSLADLGGRERVRGTLEQYWLSTACKSKDFQTFLRGGYTVQMRYSFKESTDDIVISIPPHSCGY
jgi:hypothetical protein